MSELGLNNNSTNKVEQIYISAEDSNIAFKPYNKSEEELKEKIKQTKFTTDFSGEEGKIVNGISYLNLEILNIIEKQLKEDLKFKKDPMFKKLNRERLATVLKCMGFNIIYCLQIADNIFSLLGGLISIKYEDLNKDDCIKSSVIVKQNTFFNIAKTVISAMTGTRCRIRKYFNLSYLIVSKHQY